MAIKFLAINGNRDGYGPDQCRNTLTVGELIEALQEFDEDLPIYLINDGGYTYGSLTQPYEEVYGEEDDSEDEE
jgi:hypothetical protein